MKKTILCLIFISGLLLAKGNNIDSALIKSKVIEWSNALSNRDLDKLDRLYSSNLIFYCEEHDKSHCVNVKRKALKASPNFSQSIISNIAITIYDSGVIKCDFTKEVKSKGKTKDYKSYLLFKEENGTYLITGEGDEITDNKLNYRLNIGNPIQASVQVIDKPEPFDFKILGLIIAGILIIILLIVVLKKKSKKEPNSEQPINLYPNELAAIPLNTEIELANNESENKIDIRSKTVEAAENAKKAFSATLDHTKTFITKLFDAADSIDRKLYGVRMKVFIWGCFLVLIGAPLIDMLLEVLVIGYKSDILTFVLTASFLVFIIVMVLSFIGSWRDDNGNVTWARTKSRLQTYYQILNDTVETTKTNSKDENLYKLGRVLFFIGIGWKALQNLSVFTRHLLAPLGIELKSFRAFEKITNHYYWIPLLAGIGVIAYLYKNNKQILERIKNEFGEFLGRTQNEDSKYSNSIVKIEQKQSIELVINAKEEQHINDVVALSNSVLFNDFALALQNWNPRGAYYEYEYQDRLIRHLRKNLPQALVESEYPIGDKSDGNRGRADIVINNTILIEMKRDSSAGAIQRAKGQMAQYSEAWKNKGPVILLLCDYNYEHAKTAFSSTMQDLLKLERPVLTIVAKTK